MASMDDVVRLVGLDHGLATMCTTRAGGAVHATVVNAGVVEHPVDDRLVAAFVGRPGTRKVTNLRARPQATLTWRAGWAWVTVEGHVELVGPDDPHAHIPAEGVPELLRAIYRAAGGGEHDDWTEYDRVVAAERRLAALVTPQRIYTNP